MYNLTFWMSLFDAEPTTLNLIDVKFTVLLPTLAVHADTRLPCVPAKTVVPTVDDEMARVASDGFETVDAV
jgi:hypothetical protein